jgi:hypothetical protein
MSEHHIKNQLRDEYFCLLPHIRRVKDQLEAEVRYALIPILNNLETHERLQVFSRIKECESAVDSLRRRQEGATFDKLIPDKYSLNQLKDLAGVRILVFPRKRLMEEVDKTLRKDFSSWGEDHVPGYRDDDKPLALKYYGHCQGNDKVYGEIQIVPMLTGLFWQVEHFAIYKPMPEFKGATKSLEMRQKTQEVLNSLESFEQTFENTLIDHSSLCR